MRVVALIDSMGNGGLQRHLICLGEALINRRYSFDIITLRMGELAALAAERNIRVLVPPRPDLAGSLFRDHTIGHNYDLALNMGCDPARELLDSTDLPVVDFWWGDHRSEMFSWSRVNTIIACSSRSRDAYVRLLPSMNHRVHVIDNPITISREIPSSSSLDWRERHGIPRSTFVILSLGRFTPIKRHVRLIHEALPFLEAIPDSVLYIMGSTGQDGGDWISTYNACVQVVSDLSLTDRVKLLEHEANPVPALCACDVYVSMSESEGQSLAISEALSLGKPVITTAVSGTNRQLPSDRPKNGILLPVYGPTGLAHHLFDFYYDPTYKALLGENARVYSRQIFDFDHYVSDVDNVLTHSLTIPSVTNPYRRRHTAAVSLLIITYGTINRVSPRLRAFYVQRCLSPFGVDVTVRQLTSTTINDLECADVVIFHRSAHALLFCENDAENRRLRKRLEFLWESSLRSRPTGYDLDDYVFLPDSMPFGVDDINLHLLATATFVIANSRAAASRFARYSRHVCVIENPVDDILWNPTLYPKMTSPFTIGWVAGSTHDQDAAHAWEIITTILMTSKDVRAILLGSPPRSLSGDIATRIVQIPTISWHSVPAVVAQFDVSLAPLIDTDENQCKGHGHLCEPALFRIPSVAQDTESYRELIRDGCNGFLASEPRSWVEPIMKLARDQQFRIGLGDAIHDDTWARYTFLRIGKAYSDLLDSFDRVVK